MKGFWYKFYFKKHKSSKFTTLMKTFDISKACSKIFAYLVRSITWSLIIYVGNYIFGSSNYGLEKGDLSCMLKYPEVETVWKKGKNDKTNYQSSSPQFVWNLWKINASKIIWTFWFSSFTNMTIWFS